MDDVQHTRDGLLRVLEHDHGVGPEQLGLVRELLDYYEDEDQGLLREGHALPLYEACRSCHRCWDEPEAVPRPAPEEAEIAVPWIGPYYPRARICAVAINFNKYGPLEGQWQIVRGHIDERLASGKRNGFAYTAGQYLAALANQIADDAGLFDTASAAEGWRSCSFLEAVKCSPAEGVSQPPPAMWEECPPRYLADELRILNPRRVLAIGQPVWTAIDQVLAVKWIESIQSFRRGLIELNDKPVEVFFVNHPSYGNWKHSLPKLLRSLRGPRG